MPISTRRSYRDRRLSLSLFLSRARNLLFSLALLGLLDLTNRPFARPTNFSSPYTSKLADARISANRQRGEGEGEERDS